MSVSEVTPEFLRQTPLPDPEEGDKQARGNVLVIAGGLQVPGAALLAGTAALRAGAGRLQIATGGRNALAIATAIPEALVLGLAETKQGGIDPGAIDQLAPYLKRADAVLIGPGLADENAIEALMSEVLRTTAPELPIVIDARAIKAFRGLCRDRGQTVLTPHAGEMAGLFGVERREVEADPAAVAPRAAQRYQAVVALKGATTFISSAEGRVVVCRKGNVGLATSGSGDVLAGVIAGLLARGTPAFAAVCWGVYLHAKAGDRLSQTVGPLGFLARELLPEVPRIMADLSQA
ncbi:MAG: NAD(P)H-hydrate dehydratase [Xanthobacteraceae bacterium]